MGVGTDSYSLTPIHVGMKEMPVLCYKTKVGHVYLYVCEKLYHSKTVPCYVTCQQLLFSVIHNFMHNASNGMAYLLDE